jgi:hypothetical protein
VTGNVNLYVIWYNNPTTPWASAQQTLVREWANHLSSSSWWSMLSAYPAANGATVGSMTLGGECVDPEHEGTNFTSSFTAATSIVTNNTAPSGCALPNDPHGLYLVLPSTTDLSLHANAGGYHLLVGAPGTQNMAITTRLTNNQIDLTRFPSPNGDPAFDLMMVDSAHEAAEAITDPDSLNGTGWLCAGSGEIADPCQSFSGHYPGMTNGGGTNVWNLSFTDGGTPFHFVVPSLWVASQGGLCAVAPLPSYWNVSCSVSSQCPSFSGHCLNQHCVGPTCQDGIENGTETDVDCGQGCQTCLSGKHCTVNNDCSSNVCNSGVCQ